MKNKNLFITGIVVYLVSALVAYFLFSNLFSSGTLMTSPVPPPKVGSDGKLVFDDSLPKTESCPLNGAMYSKQQRQWWEQHRPLGVMIENHEESRPQSGLSATDIVFETVAEGGITRFLAVFYCQDAPIVGPVRSARTYFLDFISGFGSSPLYAHVGGANTPGPADALGQIDSYGWAGYNDMNQFSIGFPIFWRDYDRLGRTVATEHTMYSSTSKLWELAKKRGLTDTDKKGNKWDEDFTPYTFKEDAEASKRPASQIINLSFWSGYGDYAVKWEYKKDTNNYVRSNGGVSHTDKNNNSQLSAKNIVILYMEESRANDGYPGNVHLLYDTKGSGDAVVFMDGKRVRATWSKPKRTSKLVIKDTAGKEIAFNKGRIWFTILDTANDSLTVK